MAYPGWCQAIVLKATQINQGWREEVSKQVNNHLNCSVNAVRDRRAMYYEVESKTLWCDMAESFPRKMTLSDLKGWLWTSGEGLMWNSFLSRGDTVSGDSKTTGSGKCKTWHRELITIHIVTLQGTWRMKQGWGSLPTTYWWYQSYPLRCYIVYFAWISLLINSHRQEAIKDHLIWSQQCWTANQMLWLLIQGETRAHHSSRLQLHHWQNHGIA